MTKKFIGGLKQAIAATDKYNYPITDAGFKPPILYKPLPASNSPQQYNYLYQLPADINVNSQSRYVLFFGKNPPPAPPRFTDANGNPILTADEQKDLANHHYLVSQVDVDAANAEVAAINAAQGMANPLILPSLPSMSPERAAAAGGGKRTRRHKSNNKTKVRKHMKCTRISRRNRNKCRTTRRH